MATRTRHTEGHDDGTVVVGDYEFTEQELRRLDERGTPAAWVARALLSDES